LELIMGDWLPTGKGTYGLLLRLDETREVEVGRLGRFAFKAGYYLYVGSALGPGGLAARLGRHLRGEKGPFWHIDYLRQVGVVTAVYWLESSVRYEHEWAAVAQQLPGAAIPVPRFGASDCRCPAHLFHFDRPPDLNVLGVGCGNGRCRVKKWGLASSR
jgi:Uri superfamily endonuclease